MSLTLADLRTPQTQEVIEARLLAALLARGLPVDAWTPVESGGVERTTVRMVAGTLAKLLGAKMAQAVNGRFLDYAEGDFLGYLARHFYGIERNPATFTIQSVWLTSVPTAPAIDEEPGEMWVAAPNGHRYQSIDPITLVPTESAPFRFQAELPGSAYSDPEGTVVNMTTAPAGVSCENRPPSDYLAAQQTGSSTGRVSATGANHDHVGGLIYDSVRIRIDTFGDIGTATFSHSLDGGDNWIAGGPMPPSLTILGPPGNELAGVTITFTNGTTPSFIQGSVFTMILASAIVQQGADEESDASLRARCRARWTTLSSVPTEGEVTLWAQLASPEVHKVVVDADANTPGGIIVTIASAAGPATAAAQIAVSDYILPRLLGFKGVPEPSIGAGSPEETAQVRSAIARPITTAGTVDVPRAQLVAVQQAADIAWLEYLAGVELGGVVILAELEQALLDAGAITYSGILLNGVNFNVQLDAREVAVPADGTSLVTSLSWRPV